MADDEEAAGDYFHYKSKHFWSKVSGPSPTMQNNWVEEGKQAPYDDAVNNQAYFRNVYCI